MPKVGTASMGVTVTGGVSRSRPPAAWPPARIVTLRACGRSMSPVNEFRVMRAWVRSALMTTNRETVRSGMPLSTTWLRLTPPLKVVPTRATVRVGAAPCRPVSVRGLGVVERIAAPITATGKVRVCSSDSVPSVSASPTV